MTGLVSQHTFRKDFGQWQCHNHDSSQGTNGKATHRCTFIPAVQARFALDRSKEEFDNGNIDFNAHQRTTAFYERRLTYIQPESTENSEAAHSLEQSVIAHRQKAVLPPAQNLIETPRSSFSLQQGPVPAVSSPSVNVSGFSYHPQSAHGWFQVVNGVLPVANWIAGTHQHYGYIPGWPQQPVSAYGYHQHHLNHYPQYPSYPVSQSYPRYPAPHYPSPYPQPHYPQQPIPYPYPSHPQNPYPYPSHPQNPYPQPYPFPSHPRYPIPQPVPYPYPQHPQNPLPQPVPVPTHPQIPQTPPRVNANIPKPVEPPKPQSKETLPPFKVEIYDCAYGTDISKANKIDLENPPEEIRRYVNNIVKTQTLIHEFLWTVLGRNSWDGKGATYRNVIRFDKNMFNAYQDGTQMVFGAPQVLGDGNELADMTEDDVQAHEISHAIFSFIYNGASGAYEESKADGLATAFIHWYRSKSDSRYLNAKDVPHEGWGMGDGPMKDLADGTKQYIRHMKDVGRASDHDVQELCNKGGRNGTPHLDAIRQNANNKYVRDDNNGVHIFSGWYNHITYSTAVQFDEPLFKRLPAIYYSVNSNPAVPRDADYQTIANAIVAQARYMNHHDVADVMVKVFKDHGVVVQESAKSGLQPEGFGQFATSAQYFTPLYPAYATRY